MTTHRPSKRKPQKFTGSAKMTLVALSIMGFVSSWNLIARLDSSNAQANEPTPIPPSPTPSRLTQPTITPWPTIPLLADVPPIPTLIPTLTTAGQPIGDTLLEEAVAVNVKPAPIQVAPLPALAPLPTLAPLPEMPAPPPPPPPPPPAPVGGSNQSGGS